MVKNGLLNYTILLNTMIQIIVKTNSVVYHRCLVILRHDKNKNPTPIETSKPPMNKNWKNNI